MQRRFQRWILAGLLMASAAAPAGAALQVVACEPEWGALARELAGEGAEVRVLTAARQDPHHIQARPSLVAAVRQAELVVCTGAELEVGWLPVLLRQSGNPAIQPGQPGYFEAAAQVRLLEVPGRTDRVDGDVHPSGNPHIQGDPHRIAQVAAALARRLAELDPAHAAVYQGRHADFAARWQGAIQRWEKAAAPLRGVAVVSHHKSFIYLTGWLGMVEVAQLEPKPGLEPSSAHLAGVLASLERQPARMILRTPYNDGRGSLWLAERAHIPALVLPGTVGGSEGAGDLFGLFDDSLAVLLGALR